MAASEPPTEILSGLSLPKDEPMDLKRMVQKEKARYRSYLAKINFKIKASSMGS